MTHTSTEQPEALRLAHTLSGGKLIDDSTEWADTLHAAAAELRHQHARIEELESQLTATQSAAQGWKLVPVGWQFYEDGKWWNGDDRSKDHRKNTEEARFPIRDVYAVEQQSAQPDAAQEGWCDGCNPGNCVGCGPAAPAKVQPEPSMGEQP